MTMHSRSHLLNTQLGNPSGGGLHLGGEDDVELLAGGGAAPLEIGGLQIAVSLSYHGMLATKCAVVSIQQAVQSLLHCLPRA